jgi:hypothetical protein
MFSVSLSAIVNHKKAKCIPASATHLPRIIGAHPTVEIL